MKISGIAVILMTVIFAIWIDVGSAQDTPPPDAVAWAKGKNDSFFSCSLYDGFAGCWFNNAGKRDQRCSGDCARKDKWDYAKWGGKCYCCKC